MLKLILPRKFQYQRAFYEIDDEDERDFKKYYMQLWELKLGALNQKENMQHNSEAERKLKLFMSRNSSSLTKKKKSRIKNESPDNSQSLTGKYTDDAIEEAKVAMKF